MLKSKEFLQVCDYQIFPSVFGIIVWMIDINIYAKRHLFMNNLGLDLLIVEHLVWLVLPPRSL